MQILELDSGRLSLEFSLDETDPVFAGLRAVAGRARRLSRHAFATYELIGIGSENFILMSDWDEPCLISQTEAGDALLRRVAAYKPARSRLRPAPRVVAKPSRAADKVRIA